jgi:Tfp pilus assembly protein FimV
MVTGIDWRAEARRYALPVSLLLLVTFAALIARGALADDTRPAAEPKPAPRAAARAKVKRAAAKFHLVEAGDTLGEIAGRYGTTVERLQALNPNVEPSALRVGQQIRLPMPAR